MSLQFGRVGPVGEERPVVVHDGHAHDLTVLTADVDGDFLGDDGIGRARAALAAGDLPRVDVDGLRRGAPVARPGNLVCVGLNYAAHAAESGMEVPTRPVIFSKATNTVVGPDDDVVIPRDSTRTDYEVELAVVIGARAHDLSDRDAARACIAGFAISNDVSEREFQLEHGGQWVKGKSCPTFNPLGPWLVPFDDVDDVDGLRMRTWVNGRLRQDESTADMIFDVLHIVQDLSRYVVLEPGDVVNTGTPQGVAFGANNFPYLRAGDVMELEIDGLGRQRQRLVSA